MTYYSLFTPIPGLTLLQLLLWPWIYAQALALKAWVRQAYGRGIPYRWHVTPWGRVYLFSAPFKPKNTGTAIVALNLRTEEKLRLEICDTGKRIARIRCDFEIQTLGTNLALHLSAWLMRNCTWNTCMLQSLSVSHNQIGLSPQAHAPP